MRISMIAAAMAMATVSQAAPLVKPAGGILDLPLENAVTNPGWKARPSGDQVNEAYPKLAQELKLSGRARLACVAEPDGSVDGCQIVSETPVGLGFGAAAKSLAPYFQMQPGTVDGRPVKGSIVIPIAFKMQEDTTTRPSPLTPLAAVDPQNLALAREILALQKSEESAKRGWRAWVDALTTTAVAAGETRPSLEVIDTLQESADQTAVDFVDRIAHRLAAQTPLDQLRSIRAFYLSPAGATLAAFQSGQTTSDEDLWPNRLIWTARDRLCAKIACTDPVSK